MKTAASIVFMMLLVLHPACASKLDLIKNDGHIWNTWPEAAKYGFIKGYLISSEYLVINTADEVARIYDMIGEQEKGGVRAKLDNLRTFSLKVYMPSDISVGQLKTGLDRFYSNYNNLQIPVCESIYIVRFLLGGGSEEEVKDLLRALRIPPVKRGEEFKKQCAIAIIKMNRIIMPAPVTGLNRR